MIEYPFYAGCIAESFAEPPFVMHTPHSDVQENLMAVQLSPSEKA
jgi:hypothetical protein